MPSIVHLSVKSTKTTLVIFGLSVGAQMAEKAAPQMEGSVTISIGTRDKGDICHWLSTKLILSKW